MAGPDVVAREVVVHGRVQGVFFRESCRREAQQGNLTGWVSNEPDGTVRAWFEGPKAQVDAICEWCRNGPPTARVTRVEQVNRQPAGLSGFDVR